MLVVENKFGNKLNVNRNLRLKLTTTKPDILLLMLNLHIRGSH